MTRPEDRQILVRDIEQARKDGAGSPQPVLWPALMTAPSNAGEPAKV